MNLHVQRLSPYLMATSALINRLSIGWVFAESGWGKLHNLDKITAFFVELGIPAAALQAPFVSAVELVGGLCLMLGLLTRLAAVPLFLTMLVAIVTARRADLGGVDDLLGFIEYLYMLVLLALVAHGGGAWSVDHVLFKRWAKRAPPVHSSLR